MQVASFATNREDVLRILIAHYSIVIFVSQ